MLHHVYIVVYFDCVITLQPALIDCVSRLGSCCLEMCFSTGNSTSFTCEQMNMILITMGIGGVIAIIVCCTALGMVLVMKLYRYPVHRLAMYQVIAALFFAIICVLELSFINYKSHKENASFKTFCTVVGFFMEYAIFVKLMFTLCLTFHLFCFSVFHVNINRLEIVHVLVSVITPLFFIWVPYIDNMYGLTGAWCWIKNWENNESDKRITTGVIEQYLLLYGPAILALSLAVIAVILIVIVLLQRAYGCCKCLTNTVNGDITPLLRKESHKKVLKEVLPLVAYPVVSFVLYIIVFINGLLGSVMDHVSFASFIWSSMSLTSLSTFAGVTLIVHVLILKCKCTKQRNIVDTVDQGQARNYECTFTTDTVASTGANTYWEPPYESKTET